MRIHYTVLAILEISIIVKSEWNFIEWTDPLKVKKKKKRHSVSVITSGLKQQCIYLHIYPEDQFQIISNNQRFFKLKNKIKTLNKSCRLNQYYHYLKFKYIQLRSYYSPLSKHKPLLLFHIVLLHIFSQIKCYSSQFLRTPKVAEKHTWSSRAHWPVPGSGAAPPAEHVTVTTETEGNTHMWTGSTQDGTCPAAQPTPPWHLIHDRTLVFRTG